MANSIKANPNIYQLQNPQLQQRMQAQENFGAIDKDKLKQDTAQFSQEATQQAQTTINENGFVKASKHIIPEDKKKLLISFGLMLATTVGLAVFGNKNILKMADAGLAVDDVLLNQKWYNGIAEFFKKQKGKLSNVLSNNKGTIGDIYDTLKNRKSSQKANFARGMGQGLLPIFSLTPPDVLKNKLSLLESPEKQVEALKPLLGDKAQEIRNLIFRENNVENKKICATITDIISERFGCTNKKELLEVFKKMKKGEQAVLKDGTVVDFSEFVDIKMKKHAKGIGKLDPTRLVSDWWPANIIDNVGKKIFKDKWSSHHFRGNLGDSLIKYNIVNGSMAETGLGKFIQKAGIIVSESISNFGNDKSGLGAFLCLFMMVPLFNNAQDAPKGQKVATVADDFVGTIGSMTISTPISFATTYGLASLANLKGEKLPAKILKGIGKFFNIGLDRYAKNGKDIIKGSNNLIPRGFGGALRFVLIMLIFNRIFSKPVYAVIHKIFGKPYDKAEAEQQKAQEEQKNTIIPELGITQGEFIEKVQKNPELVDKLQQNPEMLQKLQQNPKLLVDYLDGKDITNELNQIQVQKSGLSPINADLINRKKQNNSTNMQNNANAFDNSLNKTSTKENTKEEQAKPIDNVTYIPSSDFVANTSNYTEAQLDEINDALTKADKAIERAEKYLH